MTTTLASALAPEWKDRLGLTHRRSPELYESAEAVSDVPQGHHIVRRCNRRGAAARRCGHGDSHCQCRLDICQQTEFKGVARYQ